MPSTTFFVPAESVVTSRRPLLPSATIHGLVAGDRFGDRRSVGDVALRGVQAGAGVAVELAWRACKGGDVVARLQGVPADVLSRFPGRAKDDDFSG